MDIHIRHIFKLSLIILFKFLHVFSHNYDFGMCADSDCSVPIAKGITTINYFPSEGGKLSFEPNQEVTVYVKDYGLKKDLLGVEINGVKGYVPKNFIRETKYLAKAAFPAVLEFLHTPTLSLDNHKSSHLHMSYSHSSEEIKSFSHTSVPNSFNPQQSVHSVHHSEVHLESSRHHDHSHFHASSDIHFAKNDDSRNYFPPSEDINYQSSDIVSPSHSYLESENRMASNFKTKPEFTSNSDNNFQSYQATHSPDSHWQNPLQFHSQPNVDHGRFSDNMRQNFDPQSNNLPNSQHFDPQSNVVHHTHAPHTTPELMSHNQFMQSQTQSNLPPENNYDERYDETAALLHKQGYNRDGEFTNERNLETQSRSFQNSDNFGENTAFYSQKPLLQLEHTPSLVSNDLNNLNNPSLKPGDLQQMSKTFSKENIPINPSEPILPQQSFSSSTFSKRFADKFDEIMKSVEEDEEDKQISKPFVKENIPINPSEPIVSQQSLSSLTFSERIADKVGEILKRLEGDEEDDESFSDDESKHSSKPIETPFLDKAETNIDLSIKSEEFNPIVQEKLSTESEIGRNLESTQSVRDSEIKNSPTSSSPILPTEEANQFLLNDTLIKSHKPEIKVFSPEDNADNEEKSSNEDNSEKEEESSVEDNSEREEESGIENNSKNEVESRNQDNFEKKVGIINENLSNINSTEVEYSNDGAVNTSEKFDDREISLQNKENNSNTNIDLHFDDKDIVDDHKNIVVDDHKNIVVDEIKKVVSENVNVTDSYGLSSDSSKSDTLLNISDIKESENNLLNAYQTRHLKDVESDSDSFSSTEETEQTGGTYEFDIYVAVENTFLAIRTFVDALLPWIPEPLYTMLMDLEKEGISPKVTVFTAISAIPCIVLIVSLVFIKGKSKERKLTARLTILERNFYNLTAEKIILEEKLEKTEVELQISRGAIEEEKISSFKLKTEVESIKQQLEGTILELEKNVDEVDTLKGREQEYVDLIHDHEREHLRLMEQKGELETKVLEFEETLVILRDSLQEKEEEIQKLLTEKSEYRQANEIYEEKVSQLQKNCNQLLQEAEVWNLRVKELTEKLGQESLKSEELEKSLQEKGTEVESLSEAVQMFKTFEEIGTDNDECKTSEEKLKYLKNSTHNLMKLQKQEEENRLLAERLSEAKSRLLDIEVAIMDVKSENDKLKVNYNQALQDKAEAVTKLEVLTNYFKDKEIQMQKQLGVQEAVRQKTEEDASSAERRICLIEQENSSYKYQVASMKQEIEETERNLKSQISLQEKKAHENWLAARTAERKLEETKQEIMQLRQRLTLLEREQENWSNSTRDEIIRPVPKRIGNINDDSINTQDSNNSLELRPNIFPLPPHMMLPPDRPLPPLPPLPPFMPPFEPPPFRPQPWNMPPPDPLSNSDFRMTPSDYGRGRESTPPRGRNSAVVDGDLGPRQSSPITDMKDSRNSTPPHLLPDFHDIPPHPTRPFYPPPPMGPRTRYPMPPRFPPSNFRRDYPGPRRIDNQEENTTSYGSQNAPVPPDDWHSSNTRV